MAIRFYDAALSDKISKWVKDPNLRILKPEETTHLFELRADEKYDDSLRLPIIALSRDKNITIKNTQKTIRTFKGFVINESKPNEKISKTIPLNAIPIQLNYQLDIYTRYFEEADEYVRNFVFNLINYPKLEIELPYNSIKIIHRSNINIDSTIADNSDIKEHLFTDQFTRMTLSLSIEDAYLFSAPVVDNVILDNKQFEFEFDVADRLIKDPETQKLLIVETDENILS